VPRVVVVLLACALLIAVGTSASATPSAPVAKSSRAGVQQTELISRALDGGVPNGPSTNAVISHDRRWARIVVFESEASDLVQGDTNGVKDVFMVRRAGEFHNNGSRWKPGRTALISRGPAGRGNGPSFAPAVDGGFWHTPSCIVFLSAASNLVDGDTNGKVDAFVSRGPGGLPARLTPPGGQAAEDTTEVAVAQDCSRIAFVTGGRLYVRAGKHVHELVAGGAASDLSFSSGMRNDMVFTAKRGVYLSSNAKHKPKLVGPGGRNPAYNDIHKPPPHCKRRTVAYEKRKGGHWQIAARVQGGKTRIVSRRGRSLGNGDSRDPVIGNAGCYVTFESDADNLGVNANGTKGDFNRRTDIYLFTAVRHITLVQSVRTKAVPVVGGGLRPSMSFYANYILFDAIAPLRDSYTPHEFRRGKLEAAQYQDPVPPPTQNPPPSAPVENRQVYMRYLGPV
jgi:hypothetical protein